ncbi:MAG TPA: tRNA (N6-threonylcarbamoyladenosine(37)-N6)-methyltransferase TrmO [Solirubrobacterales bacterium]|jgi:tRNA-Thr(GGU) m(6)t(6)A37 methyltransferase TsaA|nr:tRNA (N6-threonylcarbamoyladenosine(37)-N6)-methyltransferase TrmO [Solirubrobacterales bacterium]
MTATDGPRFDAIAVGSVSSPLTDLDAAPKQGDEGAPEATIIFAGEFVAALEGIAAGDDVLVLAWLDRADRDVLRVHPRGDESRPETGVFATRSPDRPNPIGLHRVEVVSIDGATMTVRGLEAVDGTPVLDVKPVLSGDAGER